MTNQVILIGRLTSDLEIKEVDGKKYTTITLAIPRSYKNTDGEYVTDFVDCLLWNIVAENTVEYCRKGDLIAARGRIETTQNIDEKDNITKKETRIIADKISFLSSKVPEKDGE